jgi:vacuolar iron transporter family protein
MESRTASPEHGHSQSEVEARIAAPSGRGHLRDIIYGAIDGAVTTFAIVAGVAGAGLSPFVILALGIANVLADGFSMAAGNYSGTKAERDDARRLEKVERRHLEDDPDGERREIREILRRKGLSGDVLEGATDQIASNSDAAVRLMLTDEYGLSPVEPNPLRSAIATFVAFLAAGFVPLMPFILGMPNAFTVAAAMTGVRDHHSNYPPGPVESQAPGQRRLSHRAAPVTPLPEQITKDRRPCAPTRPTTKTR